MPTAAGGVPQGSRPSCWPGHQQTAGLWNSAPLRPSLPAGPLPSSPRWLWLPESQTAAAVRGEDDWEGGREGARKEAGNRAAALKFPAGCAGAGAPGHAGALGPRDSMKGGDRAYTRSPFLGWLFAKCCCCLPCKGEWLSEFTPSFSQRGAAECTLGVG